MECSKRDLVNRVDITWTNMYGTRYRLVLVGWQNGKQLVLQPAYKKSDMRCLSQQVLPSVVIDEDRSANERAVQLTKKCEYIYRGVENGVIDRKRLKKCWLGWGFLANFMYEPFC